MKNSDIILIISLIVVISVGIGCVILYMVNDRLSNIKIPRNIVENTYPRESFNGNLNGRNIEIEYEKSKLENPDDRDIVEYEKNICQAVADKSETSDQTQQNEPQEIVRTSPEWPNLICRNNIEKKIIEKNSMVNIKVGQDTCAAKELNQMTDYYKIHRAYPAELVKGGLKGYNIGNFSTAAGIMDIGKIDLNNSGEYSQPQNFVF